MDLSSPEPLPLEPSPLPHDVNKPSPTRVERRACQALLEDELTPCPRLLTGRAGRRWCSPHGREYKELTRAYKELSERVCALKAAARLSHAEQLQLATVMDVDGAISRAELWRDHIPAEVSARTTQHLRFFREIGTSLPDSLHVGQTARAESSHVAPQHTTPYHIVPYRPAPYRIWLHCAAFHRAEQTRGTRGG